VLTLDGSQGEGGGQILRSSLALSLITGQPFRIVRIRAGRSKPGLLRQHLASVAAAAAVGQAEVQGATLCSQELTFRPGHLRPGEHRFSVGSAGSATLVAQTVLPPLLIADAPSVLHLEGGTHNPAAPPFEFLERTFLPLLSRMGPKLAADLHRPGFYPAGGGELTLGIDPVPQLKPLHLTERGAVRDVKVEAMVAGLPVSIAERETATALRHLDLPEESAETRELPNAYGPGNAVLVTVESEHLTEVFAGFGRRGVPAETVATDAAEEARRYLESGAPVGEHLADQLLLPLALARGGSFVTGQPSGHTTTNLDVIRRFLPIDFTVEEMGEGRWRIAAYPDR
jgi:RNA 3'-terminal phosphate cyclase (ATP)